MIRWISRNAVTIALGLLIAPVACGQQILSGPPPGIKTQIDALIKALNIDNSEAWEKMAQEHFTSSQLKTHSAEERKRVFDNIRQTFGTITVGRVEGPEQPLRLHVEGSKGSSGIIELTLESSPPFKIEKIDLRVGGPTVSESEPKIEPPPINGSMSTQQLKKVLNTYLSKLAAKDIFSGDVLIAKGGEIVYSGSTGFADRANQLMNHTTTRFNIGSINKIFTKVAIEQLIARGQLSLTDSIGKLLPDYPEEASRTATVDQLLHHSGGIADIFGDKFAESSKARFRSNADYYRLVSNIKPEFAPGARTQYCNGCYVVLGAIIERVSSKPYERYIEENIFKPSGMGMTGYLQADGINTDVAIGYTRQTGAEPFQSNVLMNGASGCAAGGSYSTTADLLRFSEALRHNLIPGSTPSNDVRIGGGAPGINAILQESGPWTVVVLANYDPPSAEVVGTSVMRTLSP